MREKQAKSAFRPPARVGKNVHRSHSTWNRRIARYQMGRKRQGFRHACNSCSRMNQGIKAIISTARNGAIGGVWIKKKGAFDPKYPYILTFAVVGTGCSVDRFLRRVRSDLDSPSVVPRTVSCPLKRCPERRILLRPTVRIARELIHDYTECIIQGE